MWTVSRSFRSGGRRDAEIIPVERIVRSCHLVPRFGRRVSIDVSETGALEAYQLFYVNVWLDLLMYCTFRACTLI